MTTNRVCLIARNSGGHPLCWSHVMGFTPKGSVTAVGTFLRSASILSSSACVMRQSMAEARDLSLGGYMQKWEHKIESSQSGIAVVKYGVDGWELVSVVFDPNESRFYFFFKRPKQEKAPRLPPIRSGF